MPRRDKKLKSAKYTKQQLQSMSTKKLQRISDGLDLDKLSFEGLEYIDKELSRKLKRDGITTSKPPRR